MVTANSYLPLLHITDAATPPTVVVVDDDRAIVEVVCEALQDEGFATTSCPHGRRAQACIRQQQPNVVILDVQMPDVDGIELFRQLRADPATSNTPVIFFTANAQKLKQRLPDYQAQRAALLPKPFEVEKLVEVVRQTLAA